jgi:hypothetical protein
MQLARIAIGAKVWIIDISDKISNREANQWDSSSNMLDKMGSRTGKSTLDQVNHLEFFWGVQRGLNHWAGCLTNPYGNKIMALLRFKFMQIGKNMSKVSGHTELSIQATLQGYLESSLSSYCLTGPCKIWNNITFLNIFVANKLRTRQN